MNEPLRKISPAGLAPSVDFASWKRAGDAAPDVKAVSRAELAAVPHWTQAFSRFHKDHRYYELVEDTICPELDYRYLVVSDRGKPFAIQPLFLVDQDLLAGLGRHARFVIEALRRLLPEFMRFRMLMVGCAAGEGHLDGADETLRRDSVLRLAAWLHQHARDLDATLLVFKDFAAEDREALKSLAGFGYHRIPSLPAARLNIGYTSFEEYTRAALSRNARMHLRRALRASAQPPSIEFETVRDISPFIDDAYPLYMQVYGRSRYRFEKLTKEFFCELGRRMPERVRFFLWRRNNRIIGFSTCMIHGDTLSAEYLGLDYAVALDLHLYHRVFHDEVSWAIANGCKWYRSGQLGYDPKLHLRFGLEPLDLYVRHTSNALNAAFGWLLPLLGPARHQPVLRKFPNYADL